VRAIAKVMSLFSTMLAGSSGAVKLGHPQLLLYFVVDAKRGSPDTTSR